MLNKRLVEYGWNMKYMIETKFKPLQMVWEPYMLEDFCAAWAGS